MRKSFLFILFIPFSNAIGWGSSAGTSKIQTPRALDAHIRRTRILPYLNNPEKAPDSKYCSYYLKVSQNRNVVLNLMRACLVQTVFTYPMGKPGERVLLNSQGRVQLTGSLRRRGLDWALTFIEEAIKADPKLKDPRTEKAAILFRKLYFLTDIRYGGQRPEEKFWESQRNEHPGFAAEFRNPIISTILATFDALDRGSDYTPGFTRALKLASNWGVEIPPKLFKRIKTTVRRMIEDGRESRTSHVWREIQRMESLRVLREKRRIAWATRRYKATPVPILTADTTGTAFVTPDWSPDGTRLIAIKQNFTRNGGDGGTMKKNIKGALCIVNKNGSGYKEVQGFNASYPKWSPDGKFISFHNSTGAFVWEVGNEKLTSIMPNEIGEDSYSFRFHSRIKWSPDSKHLAFVSGVYEGGSVSVFDLETRTTVSAPGVADFTWNPSNNRLVMTRGAWEYSAGELVYIFDYNEKRVVRILKYGEVPGLCRAPFWNGDGIRFVCFPPEKKGSQPNIFFLKANGSVYRKALFPEKALARHNFLGQGLVEDLTWSHDGKKLAFLRDRDLWIMTVDDLDANAATHDSSIIIERLSGFHPRPISWAPGDGRIAYSNGKNIYVLEID